MKSTPKFIPIDTEAWPRMQMFDYFTKTFPAGFSITIDVDVTPMRKILKEKNYKFFPAYVWLVTKNLNKQAEFKTAEMDGLLGYYDVLTPIYPTLHEDDHTVSLLWTNYSESFLDFYKSYIENQNKYSNVHGLISMPQASLPHNGYTVSCIPWLKFSHFSPLFYENKPYYYPSIESGQFFKKDNKIYMPLSITCHHAASDGYHVKVFLDSLQEDINNFMQFI